MALADGECFCGIIVIVVFDVFLPFARAGVQTETFSLLHITQR
jgi:hypothetical protein